MGVRENSRPQPTADFFIYFNESPADLADDWRPHTRLISRHPADQGDNPALKLLESADGRYTRLMYAEGLDFIMNAHADSVWVRYADSVPREYVLMYLMNAVIALCLRLRESVALHASAVAIADRAVLFVGGAGAGKSTLAAHFAGRQHAVFCDDMCALQVTEAAINALPGCPRLRLLPASTEALFGHDDALTPIAEGWDKQFLDLDAQGYRFAETALPVGGVYLLQPHADDLAVRALPPATALFSLMSSTYLDYLIDQRMRALDMRVLARLVAQAPVRVIALPHALDRLDDAYDAILSDMQCF